MIAVPVPIRLRIGPLAALAVLIPLSACGGNASTTPTADVETARPPLVSCDSAASPAVPPGTRLRVADQFGLFQGVLGFAGLDQGAPYEVEYVELSPGPAQVQAFRAGEVDLGVVSPIGLIQAVAGEVDVRAIARWRTDFALHALVTAPGVEGITGWSEVIGKRVAFQRNTMGEAIVLLALNRMGKTLDDITVVDVPHSQVGTTLRAGSADVGVSSEPFVSAYLSENLTASYVLGSEDSIAQSTLIVASDEALEDPGVAAAIVEYLQRLDRAFVQLTSDRGQFVNLAVAVWRLDRGYVEDVVQDSDGVRMDGVPAELLDPYRLLVELLAHKADLPNDVDAAAIFDPQFSCLFD
jgi:sulfonate transport system substrate-binding protein